MRGWIRPRMLLVLGLATALAAPAIASAATLSPRLVAKAGYGAVVPSFVRTADGTLHMVLEANINWGDSFNGVGAISISPSGHVGAEVAALNWAVSGGSPNGIPGLAIMPGGVLQAVFGGSPGGDDGPWGISSTDGGSSWSAPADVGSGSMEVGDGQMTLQNSNGTPVFTGGCCGGIVVQNGFGPGRPTYLLTNGSDDVAGNTSSAVDAVTGAVVAGWDSNQGPGGLWVQQVAPSTGTAVKVPVPSQYGTGQPLIVASRDKGPGVFAAYPSNDANTTRIRLMRYGGGTVSVGSARHLHADTWGVATGPDGRIWVFWWGQNTKTGKQEIALTRSNRAVTAFEPIQTFNLTFSIGTLSGDGRLGPLDLFVSGLANGASQTGIYHARVLPELSASIKAVDLGGGKFKLKVRVTDAGDPVSGATVSAGGEHKVTHANGRAKLTVSGSSGHHLTVTVSAPDYRTLAETVTL